MNAERQLAPATPRITTRTPTTKAYPQVRPLSDRQIAEAVAIVDAEIARCGGYSDADVEF